MSRVSLELPPHIFAEYERWGKETAGEGGGQAKPARAMMLLVLQEIANRRIADRKAREQLPPTPLLDRDGRPLRAAPTLLVPGKRAKPIPLRRRS